MNFRDYLTSVPPDGLAAPWHASGYGKTRNYAIGAALDEVVDRLKKAVKARFPTAGPPDALAPLGVERGIERGVAESNDSYGQRLLGAWNAWPWAGTAFGILSQLRAMGYDNVYVIQRNKRAFSLDGSGDLVIFDSALDNDFGGGWATFIVVFAAPPPSFWGGVVPADSSDEANRIRRVIRKWKPGHAKCMKIVIQQTGEIWGFPPEGLWSDPGSWGGTTIEWTGE